MKKVARLLTERPGAVLLALCAVSVVLAITIPRVRLKMDVTSMVPENDPVIQELAETVEEFGSQDMMMVVIKTNVFTHDALARVRRLADEIAAVPGVEEVTCPLDVQVIRGDEFGLDISPVAYGVPETDEEIKAFKDALEESLQGSAMVSKAGDAIAIFITLEPGFTASADLQSLAREIESITELGKLPGEDTYVIGDAYNAYVATGNMRRDLRILLPLALGVVVALLYLSFGSMFDVAALMISVVMSLVWTVGLMVLLGYEITIVSMILPIILVSMGSAAGIHIINRFREELRSGRTVQDAVIYVLQELSGPVAMTSLTTAVGFASFATCFIRPVREFGIFAAVGIMLNMLITLACVPCLLVIRGDREAGARGRCAARRDRGRAGRGETAGSDADPAPAGPGSSSLLRIVLGHTGHLAVTRPWAVIGAIVAIALVFAAGIPGLRVETNFMEYFRKDSPVVQGTKVVEELFGGTYSLSVLVDTEAEDGIKEPAILEKMLQIENRLDGVDRVSNPSSIAKLLCELNKAFNGGDPAHYRIPPTREAVSQERLLLPMQGGSGLDSMASYDFQKALVSARVATVPTTELSKIIKEVEDIARDELGTQGIKASVVGIPKVMLRLMERFMDDQVRSLALSSIGVFGVVAAISGSAVIGLLCLVPLCISVILNFGLMSFLGVPLDVVTIMISGISIGIGVDYSIHLTSRYRRELQNGREKCDALVHTISSTGRGIFFNAAALMLGFGLLSLSTFRAISIFGLLVAGTMMTSGLGALLFLPAILRLLDTKLMLRTVVPGMSGGKRTKST